MAIQFVIRSIVKINNENSKIERKNLAEQLVILLIFGKQYKIRSMKFFVAVH